MWFLLLTVWGFPHGGAVSSWIPSSPPPPALPRYQNIRYQEDWSVLEGRSDLKGLLRLKHLPLKPSHSVFLSLGGQLRARVERWSDFAFGAPAVKDDSFGLSRLRLHADLHLGNRFRIFAEGKSSLGRGRDLPGGLRNIDVDSVALQNGLIDWKIPLQEDDSLTLRLGRQELQFGR